MLCTLVPAGTNTSRAAAACRGVWPRPVVDLPDEIGRRRHAGVELVADRRARARARSGARSPCAGSPRWRSAPGRSSARRRRRAQASSSAIAGSSARRVVSCGERPVLSVLRGRATRRSRRSIRAQQGAVGPDRGSRARRARGGCETPAAVLRAAHSSRRYRVRRAPSELTGRPSARCRCARSRAGSGRCRAGRSRAAPSRARRRRARSAAARRSGGSAVTSTHSTPATPIAVAMIALRYTGWPNVKLSGWKKPTACRSRKRRLEQTSRAPSHVAAHVAGRDADRQARARAARTAGRRSRGRGRRAGTGPGTRAARPRTRRRSRGRRRGRR